MRKASEMASLIAAPTAIPRKIQRPPAGCSDVVARSTSAQAVPSGYGRFSCSATTSKRRSGIIAERPRTPPRKQSATTCK